jgi:hypothetical protein
VVTRRQLPLRVDPLRARRLTPGSKPLRDAWTSLLEAATGVSQETVRAITLNSCADTNNVRMRLESCSNPGTEIARRRSRNFLSVP